VQQDERCKTRVASSGYESAFQITQWEDAIAKAAHYLSGVGGKGGKKINHSDFICNDLKRIALSFKLLSDTIF